ncbi:hypothetical protein [Bacillus marinisedimentorum]|uniref:hypothetical protein n=1 Tax=Bacillus marinisedimentorum TaxID=1821260 RepID=UPI0007DED536|nr:hypothetical protein [Bacillus marinisedimentorum]
MTNSKYDEEDIKKLLQSMPEIEDESTSEEHFRKISDKMNRRNSRRNNRSSRFLPLAATAAIFLLAGLLILPALFERNGENMASEEVRDESADMETGEEAATESAPKSAEEKNGPSKSSIRSDFESNLVLQASKGDIAVVAYPGPGGNFIVPVSFPLSQGQTPIDVYNSTVSLWDPASAGLDPFLLAGSSVTEKNDGSVLEIHVPEDHQLGHGSASEINFTATVAYMTALGGYEKADLYTGDDRRGVMLGNYGEIETITEEDIPPSGYFKYETAGRSFLVPYPHPESNAAIGDLIQFMKDGIEPDTGEMLRPVIPGGVDVRSGSLKENGLLEITLSITGDSPGSDEISVMQEGILMTARDAGYDAVVFKALGGQIPAAQYPFEEKIPVPAAPNPVGEHEGS